MKLFKKKSGLDLDETLVDDELWSGNQMKEMPISAGVFRIVILVFLLVCLGIASRIFFLSGIKFDFYSARAQNNANTVTEIPAPRGIIIDRFGKPLVENISTFSVSLRVSDFLKKSEEERAMILDKISNTLNLDRSDLEEKIIAINPEYNNFALLSEDASLDSAISLKSLNLNSIVVENNYRRHYLDGPAFSHLIGYTGLANNDDLKNNSKLGLNDIVGKSGLEAFYEDSLAGKKGEIIKYRNAKGEYIDEKKAADPMPGKALKLTIDAEFQKYFNDRLSSGLESLGRRSGAGLAINPTTGEVLAMVSLPSYDNNIFVTSGHSKEKAALLSDKDKPVFNRVTSGLYSPASTIKPLMALAAIKKNIITPDKKIFSPGYLDLPNPYDPEHPSRFLDWQYQGWVDMYSALAKSSDVYFYEVGGGFGDIKGLGIYEIKSWWQNFGLGQKTGIDLFGERSGFLPDPDEKEKRSGTIWRIGDTYHVSIGQGDLLVTPVQLLDYIASIANDGKVLRPFINSELGTKVIADHSDMKKEIGEVKKGMEAVINNPDSSAHNLFSGIPFTAAGKTGTAQINNNSKINAFFVGYAPAKDPQIAILVLVEDAREGSLNAIPVARDVLSWYYEKRIKK